DATPSRVKDIYPGPKGSHPTDLTVAGGTLYFTAESPLAGRELWSTIGGDTGPSIVGPADSGFNPGPRSSDPRDFAIMDSIFYFSADFGEGRREIGSATGRQYQYGRLLEKMPAETMPADPRDLTAVKL